MAETDDVAELLFFDTFSHEVDTDINLDLVQFPKPVWITQVRIIPLGARVQADFPGGVRLGATNPSKFDIEFFVNDLGMPGASTFENLGQLKYNQNDCIHLECTAEKIPTDGLVLRGWYSTITLAVYGILTNSINEPIASPPPPPCEPAAPEDMCNLSGTESRNASNLQDELVAIKEEWKEPLSGSGAEVVVVVPPPVHVAAHKTRPSDYERDELEYVGLTRAEPPSQSHYHHHSGDERERRLRKASHSSERSASALLAGPTDSLNRCSGESSECSNGVCRNERDYLRSSTRSERERDKSTRDWSRSPPDYGGSRHARRRQRSDADEPHKWPRTPPPTSIDSPTRPRSPDHMDYTDDEDDDDDVTAATTTAAAAARYKSLKTHVYRRSSDSLGIAPADDDDVATPGTPGEQYEPILSDDEIMDDDDDSNAVAEQAAADEFELELEAAAAALPPAIAAFDAFTMPLAKYDCDLAAYCANDLDNLRLIFKKFQLQTKCDSVAQFQDDGVTNVDERESFVYLGEQLSNQLNYLAQHYRRRNYVLQQFFSDSGNGAAHLLQAVRLLQIALDFEAAGAQVQPVFKIRHLKVGAKLAELLLGASADLLDYAVNVQHFEPYAALLRLYGQDYMALSIKLMLLKAVYALLDTATGLRHFLHGKLNGYQLMLELLQQTRLTRTKYALQAIIKKLNLHETLECVCDCSAQLIACDRPASAELQLLEEALSALLPALATPKLALGYQQPKRFLPVSKKFEVVTDALAQRSYANALQAYLQQNGLAEALLLLFCRAGSLPAALLLRAIAVLRALLGTQVGVDYLVDDCFETTQLLVAVLLGVEQLPQAAASQQDQMSPLLLNVALKSVKSEEQQQRGEQPTLSGEEVGPLPDAEPAAAHTPTLEAEHEAANKAAVSAAAAPATITPSVKCADEPPAVQRLHCLQELGIELAYKAQTRYHLDAIVYSGSGNLYTDADRLATHLHALHSQTCQTPALQYTVQLLGLSSNLQLFMELIKKEQRLQTQRQLNAAPAAVKYKSPVLSYAVDMLDCCVRHCDNLEYLLEHGAAILELAKNHESFEPSVSAVLQEMYIYLKPLEALNLQGAYDDITPLVDLINRSLEYVTTFPGDLIMGLRLLRHLAGTESVDDGVTAAAAACTAATGDGTVELKHRFVALQFYAADGMQTLIQILERLCAYFEQPGLHTPALSTTQGVLCCQILLPTLQLLRALLAFAIRCRNVEFRDLTAIDHLMRTYSLLHYFPAGCRASAEAQRAKREIVHILLAYTQPHVVDEESLHKSLWTQMIREVLKNIDAPATFVPGLRVLAELLPLPLPLVLPTSSAPLSALQAQRLVTERKLWSAHLHPLSAQIVKLIETIAPTTFPQLSDLLARVCLQLADLAPNMTLLISKTLTDLLSAEWSTSNGAPTAHLARLLLFFGRLTAYASLKSSALSILGGRLWELCQALLTLPEAMLTVVALKCQVAIHRILESFLDTEISLIAGQTSTPPELNLAAALPPKELLARIVEAILSNLLEVNVAHEASALAVRNLVILTEHDVTFYQLALALKQRRGDFQLWLQKVVDFNACGTYNTNVESLVLLLSSLTQIPQYSNSALPARHLKWSTQDLALAIGYERDTTASSPPAQLLQRIRALFEEHKSAPELLDIVKHMLAQLESHSARMDADEEVPPSEPALPQAESIVMQYVTRPIYTRCADNAAAVDRFDERHLRAGHWLELLPLDSASSAGERVGCDLTALASACCLPAETNLTADCKRVLHLSASPQSNRERTPTAPCFRTRRVEVDSTGRPEKKIYITPVRGRGYTRPPPSRGDLFRSRPPNTSRPPSLHVDDFLALETCGAQPTGPTGYNKIPPLMRGSRVGRNRGSRISAAAAYRKTKVLRTSSPSTWNEGGSPHYRTATAEPHFGGESLYSSSGHFSGRPRGGRGSRMRSYMR